MLYTQDRLQLRRMFVDAWQKRQGGLTLEPLEELIAAVVAEHPEYHAALERVEESLDRDYLPEMGETNPFLHMSLHLAVREQLATDRPPGLAAAYGALVAQTGDPHDAEHRIIECLAATLWEAQGAALAPDEQAYLEAVRRLVRQ